MLSVSLFVNIMNSITKFIDEYDEPGTKKSYRLRLQKFFKTINEKPESYINENRDYEKDIKLFWKHLKQTSKSRCTKNSQINTVKQFLSYYDVEPSNKFWKGLRRSKKDKGNRPITLDRSPTRKELRRIILEGRPMARAMFLIASSSGMRIGEILQLLPEDVILKHDPPMINIRAEYTKTGVPRTVFINNEAREYLETWYNKRDSWIETASKKLGAIRIYDYSKDPRIFPIHRTMCNVMWNNMLRKANLEERDLTTEIRKLHIHTLRKYFRTNLTYAGIPLDVVEALMGHSGYLTDAYQRYSIEQLAEMYKKAANAISIFEDEVELNNIQEEQAQLKEENKELQRRVYKLEGTLGVYAFDELQQIKKERAKQRKKS